MKLSLLSSAFVAALSLTCAPISAHAQATNTASATTTTTSTTATKMAKKNFGGTVTAVDAAGGKLTVTSKKHPNLSVMVGADTKFKGGATSLADIKVGDKVAGSYATDASGTMTAVWLKKK